MAEPLIHGHTAREWLSDPALFLEFCSRFLVIRPVSGGKLIPFVPSPIQCWFFNRFILPPYKAGESVRVMILKARQLGFSTLTEAWLFWNALAHKEWSSLIIGRDKIQGRRTLFGMLTRFHNHFSKIQEFPAFPTRLSRIEEIVFDQPLYPNPRNCKICGRKLFGNKCGRCGAMKNNRKVVYLGSSISVVGGEDAGDKLGRGGTYNAIHASEAAFYPDFKEAMSALLAACHDAPETTVIIETTANGFSGFYDMWTSAPSGWQRCFVPWYFNSAYERSKGALHFMDEEEEGLFEIIKSDRDLPSFLGRAVEDSDCWHKLFWRRYAIENICLSDVDKFHQEYPATPSEAFRFSGQAVFSAASLARVERTVCQPIWAGEIDLEADGPLAARARPTVVSVSRGQYGRLSVWEEPQPHTPYLVAADVAEGRSASNKGNARDYDYSAAMVFKCTPDLPGLVHVATWHGTIDPDRYGFALVALAKYYNNALLNWEINGPGAALKIQILDICRYRNIYLREELDVTTKTFVPRPGWRTTRGTKPVAITALQRYIRTGDLVVRDARLLEELRAFQVTGPNTYEALTGHDDLVMACAIGCATADVHLAGLLARAGRKRQKAEEAKRKSEFHEAVPKPHPLLGSVW